MSLGIYTATPEGIVLAADSRQSYRNRKGVSRIESDSASKIIKLNERCGLIVTGLAFLEVDGRLNSVGRFIEKFRTQAGEKSTKIKELSDELHQFFEQKKQIIRPSSLNFAVAGYNSDASHHIYEVHVPGKVNMTFSSELKGGEYGAGWLGQGDVVERIIKGYDHRISQLSMIRKAIQDKKVDAVRAQLASLQYSIQWGTMTLQDAIDFSRLMIETTSAMQRFADGVLGNPGDIPGVGGPIDIAVITRDKGFVWVSKKKLHSGGREVDLESVEDLEKRLAKSSRP